MMNATTFIGVPAASEETGGVTILGAPLFCEEGRDHRARLRGPAAIRDASTQFLHARIDSDLDPLRELAVWDGGEVNLSSGDPATSMAAVVEVVSGVLERRGVPIVFGGDGSTALAMLRALARHVDDLAVLHFDAHTDCNPPGAGISVASSAFWVAAEEGSVATGSSVHIGLRGPGLVANSVRLCRERGYRTIGMDEIVDSGIPAVLDKVRQIVGTRPVYVCWDMDVFDPSVAPGVASPSRGGIDAASGMRLVRGLAGLRIVAVDVNAYTRSGEVNGRPPRWRRSSSSSCCSRFPGRISEPSDPEEWRPSDSPRPLDCGAARRAALWHLGRGREVCRKRDPLSARPWRAAAFAG
jgi:arginase family enzyme